MSEGDEELTKVYIDLTYCEESGGESMWAKPLGDDLYELRNVPFNAYGLNWGDVVRAVEPDPTQKPVVQEVVRRSGHTTFRVRFCDDASGDERGDRLRGLNRFSAFFEGADSVLFAIDVEAGGDVSAVREQLDEWEDAGVLEFETCEERYPGRFDVGPPRGQH